MYCHDGVTKYAKDLEEQKAKPQTCVGCGGPWPHKPYEAKVDHDLSGEYSGIAISGTNPDEYILKNLVTGDKVTRQLDRRFGPQPPKAPEVISGEELLRRIARLTESMYHTCAKKNADYAGQGGNADAFANFKMIERLSHGAISVETGFLTRMSDKFSRLVSLFTSGKEVQVVEESVNDTLIDLANYCLLLAAYRGAGTK